MRTVLSVPLVVHKMAVFAELAWMEQRPELSLLCQQARELGGRLSPRDIQQCLPGLSDAASRIVLESCRVLNLVDRQGALTPLGEEVANSQDAPVPEQGVYSLWVASHPLLGNRILSVERLSSTRDARFENIQPLLLVPDANVVFSSVVDRSRFLLRAFPGKPGEKPEGILSSTDARVTLRWTLNFEATTPALQSHWQLDGQLEHDKRLKPIEHASEVAPLDLNRLADAWGTGPLASHGNWDASLKRLRVALEGLTEQEQESFRKSFTLPRVEVAGRGSFENVTLEAVPIAPRSQREADHWAQERLLRRLARHKGSLSRAGLRELFLSLTEDTPLEELRPTLLAHTGMLARVKDQPELFWKLAAPVDLAPLPISADELDTLQVGESAEADGGGELAFTGWGLPMASTRASASASSHSESANAFTLPYRAGWSMRELVERLLTGLHGEVSPRRLLLIDRYVKGPEALRMFELLLQTLRERFPQVRVEVWTQKEGDNFQALQRLSGSVPQDLLSVFGRSQPHDRFLVVHPAQGEGLAWQMTNSPLHAREPMGAGNQGALSPNTPLRWRELGCIRIKPEQLSNPIKQWLVGGAR